nr:MAG TPA: minor tail protein [Caudoviricetes sp.]
MLRYNYIMSVTSAQQGDFARTSGSWANQVRLLTLNIQSLASVIGQGLIAAVLPGIKALNALMSKLMQAAETFRNFMYVLMGKKIKGSTSGVVNDLAGLDNAATDLSNMENAGDDAASGLDNATSSAKALKKALSVLPFDELNQLSDNSSSSGSTPSTGTKKTSTGATPDLGFGGITDQIDDALNNEETPINKWAKKIRKAFLNHDWKGLGKTIADMINIGMQKIYDVINWKNVGPKITAFTDAFTKTFNSLVDNIDWNLMGRTLGAGLNTIVNTMNQLLDGIDWYNLGAKFGTGITGLVKEVNWTNLGNLIGNSFMKAWDMFAGLVNHLPYANIGKAFADLLNGVFEKINFTNIAHVLATGLNGAFDSLKSFTVNFKWDDLVDNITGGITTFMQQFKWKENGQKIEEFIDNLLTSLVDIANGVDWEAFGHNIGVFLSEIDWPKHLSQITTVLKEVLGGIWDGLGTTSAGTFIQAIATFTVGMKLMPFINAIVKFFTGDSVLGILSTAVRGMLGPALTSAASTTIPAFGSSLAALVGTGGGIAIAAAGAVLLTKKLAGLFETMQGGNGMTTQYGGYLHDYAAKLNELTTITNDQSEALWKMIEKDEELGKSHDEMYSDMIEKLKEYGVSTDQAKSALEQYGAQAGVSAEFVDDMTDKIQALGSGFSESAGQIDMSSLSAKEAVSILSDTLYTLSLKGDEFSGTYVGVRDQLQNTGGSAQSADEALKIVYNALQNAGVPLDDLNKKLSKDFPSATDAVTTAVKNNVVGAQEKISSTMMTASADTEKATNKMVETTTDDFAEIQKQADNYMKGVDTSTVTYWGSSSREVTKNLRQMKIDASTELGKMDETVRSHFGSQYRIALSKWQDLGRDISSYIRGTMNTSIGSGINTVVDTIKRNFSDMYSVGQNAMQNLRNGMESINIRTPHISMDYTDWQEGRTHKWRYNSRVDWYAKGGLFNAASVIGVGEAGKEAVLPLTNKQAMKSIADSITGNMPDGSIGLSKEEMTQAVTQGVAMAMMNLNAGGSSSPQYISNTINLDGRAFAKAITKVQQDNNRRKNPSPAW